VASILRRASTKKRRWAALHRIVKRKGGDPSEGKKGEKMQRALLPPAKINEKMSIGSSLRRGERGGKEGEKSYSAFLGRKQEGSPISTQKFCRIVSAKGLNRAFSRRKGGGKKGRGRSSATNCFKRKGGKKAHSITFR